MALDPRILLGGQRPNAMGPADVLGLQDLMRRNQLSELELQEAQRGAQGRNMFSQLSRDPLSFNQTGDLTPEAFRQFAGVDPSGALALRNRMLQEQQMRSAIERNISQARSADALAAQRERDRRVEIVTPAMRATLLNYEDAVKRGVPIDQAAKQAQDFWGEQVGEIAQGGEMPKELVEKLRVARFNPYVFRAQLLQHGGLGDGGSPRTRELKKGANIITQEWDPVRQKWNDVSTAPRKVPTPGEGTPGSGVGLPKGVTEFVDPKTGKYYAMGKGLTYGLDEGGKWKPVNRNEVPTKVVKVGAAAAGMGARESVFTQRVIQAGNQASLDLENVVELPATAQRGPFGAFGSVSQPSFYDAGKVVLGNKLTTEEEQIYNTMTVGFQRTLAAIESAGLMPGGTLTHMMDAVIFKPGDTQYNKMHKLAQTRQIIESGMDVMLFNPRVSPEEKEKMKQIIKRVQEAVPFTHKDLIALYKAQLKNPKATLREVLGKKMKTSGAIQQPTAAATEGKSYAQYWRSPSPKTSRSGSVGPAQGLSDQGEDPDEDSDKDNE